MLYNKEIEFMGGNILHTHILLDQIRGGDCTVLGYGISNRPLVEWLMAHGARSVTVRDKRDAAAMERDGDTARIAAAGGRLICGAEYLQDLAGDVIFRSPGFRPDLPEIKAALEKGAVLTSEMELFLALTEATVLGISGSDGKTTTTTLTAKILEVACKRRGRGRVYLGGNIGAPLLPLVEDMTSDDFAVVELSSFQLMTMGGGRVVDRAALTNVSPNHLNWHTDMAEYVLAKSHLLDGESASVAVLNARNEYTRELGASRTTPVVWFTGERELPGGYLPDVLNTARGDMAIYEREGTICLVRPTEDGVREDAMLDISRIRLPGRHNVENYMTAIALTCFAPDGEKPAAEPGDVAAVADSFTGVPHRLELCDGNA
jgi:UDP-N-acetylmuramoylalanine--D-glutamate ligase